MCFTDEWQLKLIMYVLGYISVIFLASPIIGKLLSEYTDEVANDEGLKGAGTKIGILERILVLTFVFLNEPSAISMIFAAKSIVRFSAAAEDRKFAEYYLIGTLSSITFALVIGTIINYIISEHLSYLFLLLDP